MVSNTPGSGYSSPSHLTSEVFPSNNAYSQHISVENYAESYPSLSPPATITPMSSMTGEESRDSTKDETGEEQTVLKCRWRECGKVYSDKNMLVEHINSNHIEHRKGCEDYPCHWGVGQSMSHEMCKLISFFSLVHDVTNLSMLSINY